MRRKGHDLARLVLRLIVALLLGIAPIAAAADAMPCCPAHEALAGETAPARPIDGGHDHRTHQPPPCCTGCLVLGLPAVPPALSIDLVEAAPFASITGVLKGVDPDGPRRPPWIARAA